MDDPTPHPVDRTQLAAWASDLRGIETLTPVMSDALAESVRQWRAAWTEARAAINDYDTLADDRAYRAAAAADVEHAAAMIAAGDYSTPGTPNRDAHAEQLAAAARKAEHLASGANRAAVAVVEGANASDALAPITPTVAKTVADVLRKLDQLAPEFDARATFSAWVPTIGPHFGRSDVPAPSPISPVAAAAGQLRDLLDQYANPGSQG